MVTIMTVELKTYNWYAQIAASSFLHTAARTLVEYTIEKVAALN